MIDYTVIYPAVQHDNPSNDPKIAEYGKQRSFMNVVLPGRHNHDHLERIFAGMNGGSGSEFPWFLQAHVRSMSVGDVVVLYKVDPKSDRFLGTWFICDSCGWLEVNVTQAQSWLDFPRKYGCCSFELRQWQKSLGME